MDTIEEGRFEDTNALFENPDKVDFHIKEWNDHNHKDIAEAIKKNVWLEETYSSDARKVATMARWTPRII